jgi:hypothetical protein
MKGINTYAYGVRERGKGLKTIEFASNFLLKNGFEMISIKFDCAYVKVLLGNSNFT